jgi:hypothetical protein
MFRLKFIYMLMLALAIVSVPAAGQKKKKVKDKRFDPVVYASLKDYEGTYVGIDPDYVLEIKVAADGRLEVRGEEDGRSITLANIQLKGAHLTADKVYADGQRVKFDGTFSNRILNGVSAFGILVEDMWVELGGSTLTRVFYKRN